MELTNTLLFVFLQVHLYGNVKMEYFDDSCVLKYGKIGRCMDVDSCPGAREELYRVGTLELCGYFYFQPIVCCENVEQYEPQYFFDDDDIIYKYANIPTIITPTPTPYSSDDGIVNVAAIGGEDALPLEFPHMAILGYGDPQQVQWRCGGSLISANFVLTAAHCVQTRGGEVRYVVLGAHQLTDASRTNLQAFRVNNIYKHPQHITFRAYHDIALLELERPANIQSGVKPARLHISKDIPSRNLIATGWGATELYGENSDILQKVNLTYVPFEICERSYRRDRRLPNGLIDDWQLCADGGGERRDTCQGDSGGPLQVKLDGDELYTIIGVTSLGLKCTFVPAVYTRVSNYIRWIESIVGRN